MQHLQVSKILWLLCLASYFTGRRHDCVTGTQSCRSCDLNRVDFESGKLKEAVSNIQICMCFLLGHCEPITLELCMNLPYNLTHYPNYLGHRTQKEASISWESALFPALVQTNCYKYLMFFACTILVPKCDVNTGQRVPPCR